MKGRKIKKKAAAFSFAALLLAGPSAYAAEIQEFTLDPVSVTATRMEKKDLEVPAAVRVYTAQDIENTGASSVFEALKFTEGMVFGSQGPGGQSMGNMSGDVVLRGMEKGTLVMMNGVPISLSGTVTLENLPVGSIERVEVVRGNGAVMYGSAASGGVINIITKKNFSKTIDLAGGNQKRAKAGLTWQEGKLGLTYAHVRYGDINAYSWSTASIYSLKYSNKDSIFATYQFDDNWSVGHLSSRNRYFRTGISSQTGIYTAEDDFTAYRRNTYIRYQDDTLSGSIYDNRRTSYRKYAFAANANTGVPTTGTIGRITAYKESRTGVELQKRFDLGKGNIMTGFDVFKEDYRYADKAGGTSTTVTRRQYDRMNYSLFAQWHLPFTEKFEMDLGARLTKTANTMGGNNHSNVSPQVQFLYKVNENTSIYSNIGKNFVIPTFSQIFGTASIVGNVDIRPQTGWQYEIGLKHIRGGHAWRAAIFAMDIKDNISASHNSGLTTYTNEDFKNYGIELSHDIKLKSGFNFTTGLTVSNPKISENNSPWVSKYGRYQLNFGIGYSKDKWNVQFMGNFLGNRKTGNVAGVVDAVPLFVTSLHLSYKPAKDHEIYFNMDNVLDRHAPQTHSSTTSYYYQTPRNFEIGYRFTF